MEFDTMIKHIKKIDPNFDHTKMNGEGKDLMSKIMHFTIEELETNIQELKENGVNIDHNDYDDPFSGVITIKGMLMMAYAFDVLSDKCRELLMKRLEKLEELNEER